ncbi:MAG TPA: ATPase domain-containing protein, partial [Vicinamibacterales bacterium]|nr:ATPase domain-containing protein [Vicinamibacterales bacterium]
MTEQGKAQLKLLTSGIPTLDAILGGGFPEYSSNLIAGDPGSGKTTLCHQILFANATLERPALYFTIVGEPPLKMLRYQQQFSFFDPAKVDGSIHFMSLGQEVLDSLERTLETIVGEVERRNPAFVVVDSFRSLAVATSRPAGSGQMDLPTFLQRLALDLTSRQATTFLVGEYASNESRDYTLFTMADGILWLSQIVNRNSMVRKIQAVKMRGMDTQPGLHTFRITQDGVRIFPRMVKPIEMDLKVQPSRFLSTGVAGVDDLLGGGFYPGSAILVAGPAGSGKSSLAIQFLAEGVQRGEPGVLAMFEETPVKYLEQAKGFGLDLQQMADEKLLKLIYLRPLDLSVDETLHEIQAGVDEVKATRVVIDSLTGLEIALAPSFEEDFRESLYRLLGTLTGAGVSIMMTVENNDNYTELRFSPHAVSFMTNDIILQRYVEIDSQLKRVVTVIKTRSRKHPTDIRTYEVTERGIVVGGPLADYQGIISGVPQRRLRESRGQAGLTDREAAVLDALLTMGQASEQELAQRTGFQRSVLTRALRRLRDLQYAMRVIEKGRAIYR